MKAFYPIDRFLLLSGCKICVNNFSNRWINLLTAIINVTGCIISTFIYSKAWFSVPRYQVLAVAYLIGYIGNIVFVITFNRNRKVMKNEFRRIIKDLSSNQVRHLRRFSRFLVFFCFLDIFRSVALYVLMHTQWFGSGLYVWMMTILDTLWILGNFFYGSIVYLFVIRLIGCWEEIYFETLMTALHKRRHKPDPQDFLIKMCSDRRVMNRVKENLINCFGILPVLWFLHLFFMSSGYVILVERSDTQESFLVSLYYPILVTVEFVFLCTILITVDQLSKLVLNKSQAAVDFFMRDTGYFEVEAGVRNFYERCNSFQFTVSSLFTLNKKLFLGFISALITFITMSIQIGNSAAPTVDSLNTTMNNRNSSTCRLKIPEVKE